LLAHNNDAQWPANYHYSQQEIGAPSEFVSDYYGLSGPSYTISTACSSSAKAFASARNLLAMDLCDAVLVGGVDSLCRLTLSGFNALESVSSARANPFSQNRAGITIGEGAAFFIVSRQPAAIYLAGCGDSSDAYHISAPEPDGKGAEVTIRAALTDAGAEPCDVTYINLHGTATVKNDEMESRVVNRLFGPAIPASSSKSQIGHTLGASGANEVGLCWLALSNKNKVNTLPPHCWDGERDTALAEVNLVHQGDCFTPRGTQLFISNSFAFGGNNACVAIARNFADIERDGSLNSGVIA
jgi:3-oxoacyl-[acyl-carrier-protein] synthase-1